MLSTITYDRTGSAGIVAVAHRLSEVFVGSTVNDLKEYREQVQDALLKKAEVASFLSDDWQGGYDDTVQKCKDRVIRADGYLGIFAHYYGSIPPGFDKSITHLEFLWAREKWGAQPYPRLAIFTPDPSGEADDELKKKAEALLQSQEEAYRKQHSMRLRTFLKEVQNPEGQWRIVRFFTSKNDLRESVLVTCLTWKGSLLSAARETHPQTRRVTDEELGQLGRTEYLDTIVDALSEADSRPEVPAVALLIYGNEDAGQKECCAYLLTDDQLRPRRGGVLQRGRPPSPHYDRAMLIQWTSQCIQRRASDQPVETFDDLAALIHRALERDQITLFLDQVERYQGGVAGFQQTFWQPLYEKLEARRTSHPSPHRLIFGVVAYTAEAASWKDACCDADAEAEAIAYAKLLKLPALTPFQKKDVRRWLREIEVPDEPPGRRNDLVDLAVNNPAGEVDGTPRRVFERLRNEQLWPDEDGR